MKETELKLVNHNLRQTNELNKNLTRSSRLPEREAFSERSFDRAPFLKTFNGIGKEISKRIKSDGDNGSKWKLNFGKKPFVVRAIELGQFK